MYIEKKICNGLDKAKFVGEGLCQGQNNNKTGGIFYGLFLAPKAKYCLTTDDYAIIQQHKTFKGFNDSKRFLDRSQYFNLIEGKKISAMLPKSWRKSFNIRIIKPTIMKQCNECKDGILCTTFKNQYNENKEFEANLNLLKKEAPDEFVYTLPSYKI